MPRWLALSISSFSAGLVFYIVMPYLMIALGKATMRTSVLSGSFAEFLSMGRFTLIWAHVFGWPIIWAAEKLMPRSSWRYIVVGTLGACVSGIILLLATGLSFERESMDMWLAMIGFCFFSGLVTTLLFTLLIRRRAGV